MRSETVHFSITAEAMTRLARDMFLSDRPDKAYRLLTTGLIGNRGDLAVMAQDLLDGKVRLTDDEDKGMGVEDEDLKDPEIIEYRKQVAFLYAGRICLKGVWVRPYAKVQGYGAEDYKYAMAKTKDCKPDGGHNGRGYWRAHYYADEGDMVISIDRYDPYVLFQRCGPPPIWWQQITEAKDAVADLAAKGRELETRGYEDHFTESLFLSDAGSAVKIDWTKDEAEEVLERQRQEAGVRVRKMFQDQYREKILAQANGDLFDITDEDGKVLMTVPRAPFVRWALGRTNIAHLSPPWTNVCPVGMKLQEDNADHTDWFIGGGGDLEDGYPYDSPVHHAAVDHMGKLQRQYGNYQCTVIVRGAVDITPGEVGKNILVVSSLDPKYLSQAMLSRAIITEAGGAMAHLAQVANENGLPIVLVAGATKKFTDGMRVTIDTATGRVDISVGDPRYVRDLGA